MPQGVCLDGELWYEEFLVEYLQLLADGFQGWSRWLPEVSLHCKVEVEARPRLEISLLLCF